MNSRFLIPSILKYFLQYLGIGVINTIIGYGTIFGLMFTGVNPFVSNGVGYSVGITVSYVLNKTWNFKSTIPHKKAYPRFAGLLFLAYLVNVVVLYIGIDLLAINEYITQIIAGVFYTGIGFLGSHYIVFERKKDEKVV